VPERVALRGPGDSFSIGWTEYAAAVERTASSLAGLGVGRGDRVAFLSGNRLELAVAEVAAMHLGAAGVALYPTSPAATIEHVLVDSEPSVLLVESALEAGLTEIRHSVPNLLSLDAEANGLEPLAAVATPAGFDFGASWGAVTPEDLAALIYTSGTTGPPKAVEWTHRAAIGSLIGFDEACGEDDGIHDVCFAPFASLAERFGGHWHALLRGSSRTICGDPTQLLAALLDARPTRLGGPPQLWRRLKLGLEATLDPEERAVLGQAVERFGVPARGGAPEPLTDSQEETLAALRARIGLDRIVLAGSTAAACPEGVHRHYNGLGVPFREFFAMTEAGVIAAQRPRSEDFGTLGPTVSGYELQIAPGGEVLVRSADAPQAYRDRPSESAETYGADGWIHTGDVGELDSEGRLRLVDRKKEMIVPEHGHNVSPVKIESALKDACPLVA
jgi:long-subunit acyl-CoA synthetase (AMP-forming)